MHALGWGTGHALIGAGLFPLQENSFWASTTNKACGICHIPFGALPDHFDLQAVRKILAGDKGLLVCDPDVAESGRLLNVAHLHDVDRAIMV